MADKIRLVDDSGREVLVAPEDEAFFRERGYRDPSPVVQAQKATAANLEKDFGDQDVRTAAEGVARGVSFGLSDLALRGFGVDPEGIRLRREVNPVAAGGGEFVGALGSTLLGGALAGGARLGTAGRAVANLTPGGLAGQAAERVGARVARGTGSKVLGLGADAATEGALYGAGSVISDAALANEPLSAEAVIGDIGLGTLTGGLLGGGFGVAAGGVLKGASALKSRALKRAQVFDFSGEEGRALAAQFNSSIRSADGQVRDLIIRSYDVDGNFGLGSNVPKAPFARAADPGTGPVRPAAQAADSVDIPISVDEPATGAQTPRALGRLADDAPTSPDAPPTQVEGDIPTVAQKLSARVKRDLLERKRYANPVLAKNQRRLLDEAFDQIHDHAVVMQARGIGGKLSTARKARAAAREAVEKAQSRAVPGPEVQRALKKYHGALRSYAKATGADDLLAAVDEVMASTGDKLMGPGVIQRMQPPEKGPSLLVNRAPKAVDDPSTIVPGQAAPGAPARTVDPLGEKTFVDPDVVPPKPSRMADADEATFVDPDAQEFAKGHKARAAEAAKETVEAGVTDDLAAGERRQFAVVSEEVHQAREEALEAMQAWRKAVGADQKTTESLLQSVDEQALKRLLAKNDIGEVLRAAQSFQQYTQAAGKLAKATGDDAAQTALDESLNGLTESLNKIIDSRLGDGAAKKLDVLDALTAVGAVGDLSDGEVSLDSAPEALVKLWLAARLVKHTKSSKGMLGSLINRFGVGAGAGAARSVLPKGAGMIAQGGAASVGAALGGQLKPGRLLDAGAEHKLVAFQSTNRLRDRVAKTLDKLVEHGAKGATRGGVPATLAVLNENRMTNRKGPKHTNATEAIKEYAQVLDRVAADPVGARQTIAGQVNGAFGAPTEFEGVFADRAIQSLMFLHSKVPRDPGTLQRFGKSRWRPTPMQAKQFANYLEGTDYNKVLSRIENGTLTRQHAEAFRETYPEAFNYFREQMIERIDEIQENVDYGGRIMLSIFYQAELDSTMRPDFIKRRQQSFDEDAEANAPEEGANWNPSALNGGRPDKDLTAGQALRNTNASI